MSKYIGTIQQRDVDKHHLTTDGPDRCPHCGQRVANKHFIGMGMLQKQDVGKRVYLVSGPDETPVYQMENNEQRDRRVRLANQVMGEENQLIDFLTRHRR